MVISLADAERRIPGPPGQHFVDLLKRGTLQVKLSRPLTPNVQSPRTQDELYVVVRGRGVLHHGGRRDAFGPGDLLFVAAGTEHHFEDHEDLEVWVVFYGREGGEAPR
jgi:mannose-6-phosphate isomerase-like protein (cupin superfamily)